MSAFGGDDVQERLYDLEQEERRIMQELMEIDNVDSTTRDSSHTAPQDKNPRQGLNGLLADCEKEVRNAKGFIKSHGPPIQISRCKPSAGPTPKHATFLSRPKDTGVDFTVPVTLPEYLAVIKSPIFLNNIRDKCKNGLYTSSEDYLDDMRLLARNTATFNRGEDLAWVVQHARLLLEAAEDAVSSRRLEFYAVESALRQADAAAAAAAAEAAAPAAQPGSANKRKRTHEHANGVANNIPPVSSIPPPTEPVPGAMVPVGARLSVLWHEDQLWYTARVVKKPSVHRADVVYDEDSSRQLLDLRSQDWRPIDLNQRSAKSPTAQGPASTAKGRKSTGSDPPPMKRSKGVPNAASSSSLVKPEANFPPTVIQGAGLTKADMEEYTEFWSARLEQVKLSLLEEMHTRFDRIEQSLLRSDPMRRVLLAVNDLSDSVMESSRRIEKSLSSFESNLSQSATERKARALPEMNGEAAAAREDFGAKNERNYQDEVGTKAADEEPDKLSPSKNQHSRGSSEPSAPGNIQSPSLSGMQTSSKVITSETARLKGIIEQEHHPVETDLDSEPPLSNSQAPETANAVLSPSGIEEQPRPILEEKPGSGEAPDSKLPPSNVEQSKSEEEKLLRDEVDASQIQANAESEERIGTSNWRPKETESAHQLPTSSAVTQRPSRESSPERAASIPLSGSREHADDNMSDSGHDGSDEDMDEEEQGDSPGKHNSESESLKTSFEGKSLNGVDDCSEGACPRLKEDALRELPQDNKIQLEHDVQSDAQSKVPKGVETSDVKAKDIESNDS